MFFHLDLNKDIEIEPRFFGPRLQDILKQKVTSEVKLAEACVLVPRLPFVSCAVCATDSTYSSKVVGFIQSFCVAGRRHMQRPVWLHVDGH